MACSLMHCISNDALLWLPYNRYWNACNGIQVTLSLATAKPCTHLFYRVSVLAYPGSQRSKLYWFSDDYEVNANGHTCNCPGRLLPCKVVLLIIVTKAWLLLLRSGISAVYISRSLVFNLRSSCQSSAPPCWLILWMLSWKTDISWNLH